MLDRKITKSNLLVATILAYALVPAAGLATDMYLPSMPRMSEGLQVSQASIRLTLSLFLISYGLSQILGGSILDAFGRYKIVMVSLLVFAASCLVTAWSASLPVILVMRVVQGVSAGFIVVGKRALFVDMYTGAKLHRLLTNMTIVWSTAPIIAPFLGGYLEIAFGWQSNFYALALYALLLFVLEWRFSGESIRTKRGFHLKETVAVYSVMLRTPDFVFGIMLLGATYGAAMVYSLAGPFIIEHEMGYTPVVSGYGSLLVGVALMLGGIVSRSLITRTPRFKGTLSLTVQAAMLVVMITVGFFQYNQGVCQHNIYTMLGIAFIYHVFVSLLFNVFFALSLARFPQYAAISNGLVGGGLYFLISFFSYAVVALVQPDSQMRLGFGYLCCSLLAVCALFLRKMFMKNLNTKKTE